MTSANQLKTCVECQRGVATCNGCRKHFCSLHFTEHRQELEKRMNELMKDNDQLRATVNSKDNMPDLLIRIDQWEKLSIERITDIAKQARFDLRECLDRTKHQLMDSIDNMDEQLKSKQASTAYTEKELDRWMRQLEELRRMIENPANINIIQNESRSSSIQAIKVTQRASNNKNYTGYFLRI